MALTDAQLEERRTGIGGSDVAAILGISPFNDPLSLYLDKRGELPVRQKPPKNQDGLYWGSLLEEPICKAYSEVTGYKVIRQNNVVRSKEHPFMLARVDRKVLGTGKKHYLEAKSDAWGLGWGEQGSSEIPPYVMCQVQHYMKVLEADQFDLPVLIGNRDFRIFSIIPIPEIIERIILAEEEFWDRVTHGIPPEPNWQAESVTRLMKDLYPGTDGSVVRLPDFAQDIHNTKKDAEEQAKLYDGIITGCKNRMASLLGDAAFGVLPDGSVYTRKLQKRASYTVKETEFVVTRHTNKVPKDVQVALDSGQAKQVLTSTIGGDNGKENTYNENL